MFSCNKKVVEYDSKAQEEFLKQREKIRIEYFKTILNHPTRGLYKDYDVWNHTPLNKISHIDSIKYPIIEVVRDSNSIQQMIIHSNNGFIDTLERTDNGFYKKMIREDGGGGVYSLEEYDVHIFCTKNQIITLQTFRNRDTLNSFQMHTVTTKHESISYYMNGTLDTMIYVNEYRPNFIPTYFNFKVYEKISQINNLVKVNFFIEKFDFSQSINSDFSKSDKLNHNNLKDEKYYFDYHSDYFVYSSADENVIYYPLLNKKVFVSNNNYFFKFRSYFWYLWETRWSNTSFALPYSNVCC